MKSDWRGKIIGRVTRGLRPITLVSDPDTLLGDPEIQSTLEKEGYIIYKYTDHILFRYNFETSLRPMIQNQTKILVLSEIRESNIRQEIPFDLIKKSHLVNISLNEIFPHLDYQTIKEVSINQIDRLYAAYQDQVHNRIGRSLTYDFILQTLYGVDHKSIITQTDYLVELSTNELPGYLYVYLNTELKKKRHKPTTLFQNHNELQEFLQNMWRQIVKNRNTSIISEFERLRPILINGFFSGELIPLEVSDIESYPSWMLPGLVDGSKTVLLQEITSLLERLESTLYSDETPHKMWRKIADIWAQILVKIIQSPSLTESLQNRILVYQKVIDTRFSEWILKNHQSLFLVRERNPVTLSQITSHIQRKYPTSKAAILVIDGMSADQWIKIKQTLASENKINFTFQESLTYAAIPTITSISRQTIASGTSPSFFNSESQAFNKEKSMWVSNWERKERTAEFKKGLHLIKKDELHAVKTLCDKDALLLITTYLDDQLHDARNGKHQIHNDVNYWVREGILSDLLQLLDQEDYLIFITSDHGNVESQGIGTLRQGLLSEKEGSRVRIYNDLVFAEQGHENYPDSILYPDKPSQNHYFLYAPDRKSFKRPAERSVSHGGLSIEEVIVPFIKVEVQK